MEAVQKLLREDTFWIWYNLSFYYYWCVYFLVEPGGSMQDCGAV